MERFPVKITQEAWAVRRRQDQGDPQQEDLFAHVGAALTWWETAESELANLFDALVSGPKAESTRAGFRVYCTIVSTKTRCQMLEAAVARADLDRDLRAALESACKSYDGLSARRNEIAHGRVFDLGPHGYYLCPNNTMLSKWTRPSKEGDGSAAKYQYTSEDLAHYIGQFVALSQWAAELSISVSS